MVEEVPGDVRGEEVRGGGGRREWEYGGGEEGELAQAVHESEFQFGKEEGGGVRVAKGGAGVANGEQV